MRNMLPCFFHKVSSVAPAALVGGGINSEVSSGSSSSSTSDDGNDEGVLQILKRRKFELKNELKEVRKQIRYLEKSKKKGKKKSKRKEKRKKVESAEEEEKKSEEDTFAAHISSQEQSAFENLEVQVPTVDVNHETEKECISFVTPDNQELSRADANIKIEDVSLSVGQIFCDFPSFAEAFEKYCTTTFSLVRKRKSWTAKVCGEEDRYPYRRIEYVCVNYGEPKRREKDGSRPKQTYSATGCNFELHVQLNLKKRQYSITRFIDQHSSHTPNEASFLHHSQKRKLTPEEQALYIEKYMMELEVPARRVKMEIAKDVGKFPTTKNLRRYIQTKLNVEGQPSQMKKLIELLSDLRKRDPHSVIKLVYADSTSQDFASPGKGILKIVFVETGMMKKMLQKHGTVVLIDGTYNLTSVQYVLVPFHVIDNHFRTRVCGFALLSNETANVVGAAMEMFADANRELIDNIKYFVVDKDFVEISSIADRFGGAQIIICQWHAMRAIDRQIHKLNVPSHCQRLKKELGALSKQMIQCHSREEYFEAWQKMVEMCQKHSFLQQFVQYMTINWHNHREMFCTYKLQQYSLFYTFTNNRAENFNKQLKAHIRKQSPLPNVVKKLLDIAEAQATETLRLDVKSTQQVFLPRDTEDPIVKKVMTKGRGLLSHATLKQLQEECEEVKNVPIEHISTAPRQTTCSKKSGPCNFSKNLDLPCRHLLATKKNNDEPLLEMSMISNHWLVDKPEMASQEEPDDGCSLESFAKTLLVKKNETARKAKFKDCSGGTMKEMAVILSQYPEKERQQFSFQLEMLINAWNNGIKTKIDKDTIKFLLASRKQGSHTDDCEDLRLEDLIFSPKKENKSYKTGGDIPKKIRRKGALFPKEQGEEEHENKSRDNWQRDVISMMRNYGATRQWTREDFERLIDEKRVGSAAYLNDSHFHYVSVLLKQQFPEIQSLQDTVDYKVLGLKKVDPSKPFIQPVHSGAFHWALLTNIPLSQEERSAGNKICLFDSLVHLEKDSETQCKIPPAITWQAAQLLKKEKEEEVVGIDIICMPCEQQQNAHDCGIFVICNMTAVALGYTPSSVAYKGNLREQFLQMIKSGRMQMFQHEYAPLSGSSRVKFMTPYNGRIKKKVPLRKMHKCMLPICYCQMPETWDNVVCCDSCQKMYHQSCNLMGASEKGASIAAALKQFYCFNCKKPGDYNSGFIVSGAPNQEIIEDMANKILVLPSYKLCHHYNLTERVKVQAPRTIHDYRTIEEIIIKFDLNALCHRKGPLYVAINNFYNKNSSAIGECSPFQTIPVPQLIVFAIALICDVSGTECPPIWTKQEPLEIGANIGDIQTKNVWWMKTIGSHLQDLEKKMRTLEKIPPGHSKAQDIISHLTNNLREAKTFIQHLSETLSNSDVKSASEKQIRWKEDSEEKIDCLGRQIDTLFLSLENYLSSA